MVSHAMPIPISIRYSTVMADRLPITYSTVMGMNWMVNNKINTTLHLFQPAFCMASSTALFIYVSINNLIYLSICPSMYFSAGQYNQLLMLP